MAENPIQMFTNRLNWDLGWWEGGLSKKRHKNKSRTNWK